MVHAAAIDPGEPNVIIIIIRSPQPSGMGIKASKRAQATASTRNLRNQAQWIPVHKYAAQAKFGLRFSSCMFLAYIVGMLYNNTKGGGGVAKYDEWLTEDGLLLVSAWARDGLTMLQIAENIGIAESTFYEWRERFPEFRECLRKSRELADILVENALFKRAVGYSYTEKETVTDAKGVRTKVIEKQMAPDVGAQAFWLKNRRPAIWKERRAEIMADDSGETGVIALAEVEGVSEQ
jgi:hypothetical protein